MIEEVITYAIVAGAAAFAIYRMVKRVMKKKSKAKDADPGASCVDQSACGGCTAECMMRNATLTQKRELEKHHLLHRNRQ